MPLPLLGALRRLLRRSLLPPEAFVPPNPDPLSSLTPGQRERLAASRAEPPRQPYFRNARPIRTTTQETTPMTDVSEFRPRDFTFATLTAAHAQAVAAHDEAKTAREVLAREADEIQRTSPHGLTVQKQQRIFAINNERTTLGRRQSALAILANQIDRQRMDAFDHPNNRRSA